MKNPFTSIRRGWAIIMIPVAVAISAWIFAQVVAWPMRDLAYQLVMFNTAWQQRVQGYCKQLAPDCQGIGFERHLLTTQLHDAPLRWMGGQTFVHVASRASANDAIRDRMRNMVGHDREPMVVIDRVQETGSAK